MRSGILILSVLGAYLVLTSAVFAAEPVLEVSPTYLEFSAYEGGNNPANQILSIWRGGGNGPLNWQVIEDCNWLVVEPNSGKSMGEVDDANVIVDISGLVEGTYNCYLTVDAGTAVNSPQVISVHLSILPYVEGALYVPLDYLTIQGAIDAAVDGNIVIIALGIYTGSGNRDLDFGGRAITVRSTDPEDPCVVAATVIDCENSGRGFYFHSGEGPNSVVAGLTITNGYVSGGGGICCDGGNPTIYRCTVVGNSATVDGGGILINGTATISHCTVLDNSAGDDGGGIYCELNKNPTITNCIIAGNSCIGALGDGGGIYCYSSGVNIIHCTVVGNTTNVSGTTYGGGIFDGWKDTIKHCIVWGNSSRYGSQIRTLGTKVSYCDIQGGWPGEGNIDANPCFINLAGGDYHLSPESPCIHAGDPNYVAEPNETDIDGEPRVASSRIDIGSDEFIGDIAIMRISPTEFEFFAVQDGCNPGEQVLHIVNAGFSTLDWQISEDCGWLSAEPNNGSCMGGEVDDVNLSVDISGLDIGLYNCSVTISDPNAVNSPQIISVHLSILPYVEGAIYVPLDYLTIQAAIDDCNNGGTIIVAMGIYTGAGNRDLDFGSKAITVRSIDPNDPSVVAATVIDCENANGHRGFYFHSGEGPNSIVSGLTITRGKAYVYGSDSKGGGIYCEGSSPTIKNCTITNNLAYGSNGTESSPDGKIGYGGGVYCTSNSHLTLIGCTVSSNEAKGGKGCDEWCGMSGCTGALGRGGDAYGGGIYSSSDCNLTIVDCIIIGNSTLGGEGGLFEDSLSGCVDGEDGGNASGGGIYCGSAATIINNCSIVSNSTMGGDGGGGGEYGNAGTGLGGGLCGSFTITNSTLSDNSASLGEEYVYSHKSGGGGICSTASSSITNCVIMYNQCDYESHGTGVLVLHNANHSLIKNCTIFRNECSDSYPDIIYPYAVDCYSKYPSSAGDLTITDSIIWDHNSLDVSPGSSVTYSCTEQIVSGVGNIHSDPCFVRGPEGDYYLSQIAAGQTSNSPCIDAGSDTAAALGMDVVTTRTDQIPDSGTVDMGYHYSMLNPADIDGDGDIDFVDYAILASQWLEEPGLPSADIAPPGGDNIVDGLDLGVLADNWPGRAKVPRDPNGPIAHWKFDEGSGCIAYDSVGYNDGIIYGANWTTGKINGALSFDDANDCVDLGRSISLKPPLPVTICAWIKLNTGGFGHPWSLDTPLQDYTHYGIFCYAGVGNSFTIFYGDGGGAGLEHRRSKHGTTEFEADRWYHVAAVLRGPTDMNIYIDAIDDGGTYYGEGGDLAYSNGSSSIGRAFDHSFDGVIDDVRVYDRALSAEEIEQIYQEGL